MEISCVPGPCGEKATVAAPVLTAPILPFIASITPGRVAIPRTETEVTATKWQLSKKLRIRVAIR